MHVNQYLSYLHSNLISFPGGDRPDDTLLFRPLAMKLLPHRLQYSRRSERFVTL